MHVAFAGGVGGAKLAVGLSAILPPGELMIVVNTGDDFDHLGLRICPDLDTVMYTLAGIANPDTGWGIAGETWSFLSALERLGGETWFRLGDRDLATHVERTRRLRAGESLSEVTRHLCRELDIAHDIVPMSDDDVRTVVATEAGDLGFQEYFVARQCGPAVTGFRFEGAATAAPAPAILAAAGAIESIILCPSNPFVSIAPILEIPVIRRLIASRAFPVVAVSPIIAGAAVKGPAGKMLAEMGLDVSAAGVARYYDGTIDGMVVDRADAGLAAEIDGMGLRTLVTDTLMRSAGDKERLAREVLSFAVDRR